MLDSLTPGVRVATYDYAREHGYQHECSPPRHADLGDKWRCECGCPWRVVAIGGGMKRRTRIVSASSAPWERPPIETEYWEAEPPTGRQWVFDGWN